MSEISLREAIVIWWRIGVMSFGGPAGQIALMHRIVVEEKRWLDEARFLHALNYCMLLPGPEAQQLATYIGWLLHGVRGGLVAGILFILPGAFAIMALSWLYVLFADLSAVEGLFFGMKAAVLAIVCQALIRIAQRALRGRLKLLLAVAGFMALFVFAIPFPFVVISAGAIAFVAAKIRPSHEDSTPSVGAATVIATVQHTGTMRAALICLLLWLATLFGLHALLGSENTFTQIADFFSRMAVVSFGGAYAVLSYVAQQAVEQYQWLAPGEMLDGLGLAETTPGPLILVTQFVGFLGAWRQAGVEPSLLLASIGALLTTWVTFLPCFLWIFAGAPYVEKLREHKALAQALAGITAVVVGVIANLALWFALNFLFASTVQLNNDYIDMQLPVLSSINIPNLVLSAIAFLLLFVLRLNMLAMLGTCALLGMMWTLF